MAEQPGGFRFQRDDTTIFVERWGRATDAPILILDGIGCTGWAFRRIVPVLSRDHAVLHMHYRGHGQSPNPPRPWRLGMHVLADDAAAALDHAGIDAALVVGFSMGFQVALETYRRHRSRVGALVSLAGPSGRVLQNFQHTDVFAHTLPIFMAATRYARNVSASVWRRLLPSKLSTDIGLRTSVNADRIQRRDFEFYFDQMAAMSPELFVEMLREAHRHCGDDVLARIRVPTLIVAGARDSFVPLATMRKVAFTIPHAEWVVLQTATHALPAEYPNEIAERLAEFAARVA